MLGRANLIPGAQRLTAEGRNANSGDLSAPGAVKELERGGMAIQPPPLLRNPTDEARRAG
ncbi:MAG: hypothetical protein WKF37_12280 [Bryobacteraceae bacterium]